MDYLDNTKPVSLYIHIPFCTTKCGYCAFYSLEEKAVREGEKERFLNVLMRQLDALVEDLKRPFHTIFIGGGNPGIIGYDNLYRILKLASRYGKAKDCTTEINPETLNENIAPLFEYLTRISVGIQSMKDESLITLGRNAKKETNIKALNLLSKFKNEYGISFNADIMTNIPGENIQDALNDIDEVASFNPDHISLYSLTFEEGTRLIESCVPMDEEEQRKMLISCWDKLESLGYHQYEISNFARKGKECLHNKVYWALGQYIGLGPTAESSVGYRTIISSREPDSLSDYLVNPSFESVKLKGYEAEEEYLLTTLRTGTGIDKKEYFSRFCEDFDEKYGTFIQKLDKNLYEDTDQRFCLTREGFLLLDNVILSLAMAI